MGGHAGIGEAKSYIAELGIKVFCIAFAHFYPSDK